LRYNFAALQGYEESNAMLRSLRKPIRTVLLWQLAATAAMAVAAAPAAGAHAAMSVGIGGAVSVIAGLAAALVASLGNAKSAGGALAGALRAEAVRIGLAFLLLWLVLANYREAAVGLLLGACVVTMLIFSMAFFVRD
jgi:hypothetical protein